jgi:ribonuclease Z
MLGVTILGNNSAIPAYGRHPTAQVLITNTESFLIDCGEGTQMQMALYKIKKSKINCVFISHLHGDHYFGLIGFLTSQSLSGRKDELTIFGPPALQQIIQLQLNVADTILSYPLHFVPLTTETEIYKTTKISVHCFKVEHRIDCWGFFFKEIKNPRKIDAARCKSFEVPQAYFTKLQMGQDYVTQKGTIIKNKELTIAATPPKSYAYCADTIFLPSIATKIMGATLLYHEATYLTGLEELAAQRYHSTTTQAAQIALQAKAHKLLIGHFSSKYPSLTEFAIEAKTVFNNTELAVEGVTFII